MITRSKLVEQLRESQIRNQHRWAPLILFSPKPQITNSVDAVAALFWALLSCVIVVLAYLTLYFRYIRLSIILICFGILLHVCLKISRHRRLARKRERKLLLPLSM